jgi:hypothetical protein
VGPRDALKDSAHVDVNTFVGPYPFRHVPHPDTGALLGVMDREGISHSLVGYLPAPWHRSVVDANDELFHAVGSHAGRLSAVPAINAHWPGWESELQRCVERGAPAVRAYPPQWGDASASASAQLAIASGDLEIPVILTTKFEDARQRHWMDSASDVSAAMVRTMVRASSGAKVILTCAGRSLIEETHWSLTPAERARIWYDISWVWGPPQDDFAHLLRTIGAARFLFGSMWPLRLVQTPFANIELLPNDLREATLADAFMVFPRLKSARDAA